MNAGGLPLDWERLEVLFEAALALPPPERSDFLDRECTGAEQRAELESLLARAAPAERLFDALGTSLETLPSRLRRLETGAESATTPDGGSLDALDTEDSLLGRTIGHYRIETPLGSGGMGVLYRARDTRLEREVALKFLPPHLGRDAKAKERFLVEARAAAALEHPNICTVHEIGETEDGRLFIAMACYEGETLEARIDRGPLPVEEAVTIAARIARGLAAAHARGIVHRDVKPGNVMLTADSGVRLLDFGLARVVDVAVTRPSVTPGTVAYMSPEQLRGVAVDARTDLWALGVVLYEMLTGVRPFRGGNDRAVIQRILHDEPEPLKTLRPEAPAQLTRIVERLLQKDPEARFESAEELSGELAPASSPAAGPPRSSTVRRRWPAPVAAAIALLIALVALGGAAVWLTGRGQEPGPQVAGSALREPSIAVLPLANHSPDPADAVLADGMTDELVTTLAGVGDLRVIARTSAFAFRDRDLDVRRIADSLRVSNILEGSFQKVGSRLRIQVRLVDGRDGSTRWSEAYEREIGDILSVQEEIARAVARELGLRLGGHDEIPLRRGGTRDVAAYELYLRGSDPAVLRSDSAARRGLEYFRQAIALDSTYAAAWAGLARMSLRVGLSAGSASPSARHEAVRRAREAARRAVSLDDSLAEAHAARGLFLVYGAYDLASAESALRRAVELDPSQSLTREWLAQLYIATGRPAEGLAEARRALVNDPLSPSAHAEVAHALLAVRRYDEALARLERIKDVRPPLLRAAHYTARAYAGKGMWPEAIVALRPQAEAGYVSSLSLYAHLLARAGRRVEALRIRDTLLDQARRGDADAFAVATVYAGLGDLDEAFAWLDRSIDDRSVMLFNLSIMAPMFEDLHADPRFEKLKPRLGFRDLPRQNR